MTSPKSVQNTGRVRLSGDVRRQKVVSAARRVFLKHGYEGARTKQIADEGRMAEAMIYKYFKSKEELFAAAVVEPFETVIAHHLEEARAFSEISPYDRIEHSDQLHRDMHLAMVELVQFLGPALFANAESGKRFYQERLLPLWQQYEASIIAFQQTHKHREIDPVTLSRMLLGMHLGLAIDAAFRGEKYDPDSIGREITDLVYRGHSGPPVIRRSDKPAAAVRTKQVQAG